MSFTLEQLKGVPEDVVSGYTKREEDGKTLYDVTFKTPDIFPLVGFRRTIWALTANSGAPASQVQIRGEPRDSQKSPRRVR